MIIDSILEQSKDVLSVRYGIKIQNFSFVVRETNGGLNSVVYVVELFNRNVATATIAIKLFSQKNQENSQIEYDIVTVLYSTKSFVAEPLFQYSGNESIPPYNIMEYVEGVVLSETPIVFVEGKKIIDLIRSHQEILQTHKTLFSGKSFYKNINNFIEYEKKIEQLANQYLTDVALVVVPTGINTLLNSMVIMNQRSIVTDRSSANCVRTLENEFYLIDFSTVRIGTIFDNFLQWLDDPKTLLTDTDREALVEYVQDSYTTITKDQYYAAALYTNFLQAVFNREGNKTISNLYIKKVNYYYQMLYKTKGILLDCNMP